MRIIHQNGYPAEELALYRMTVYKNLLECAKNLIGAYDQFGLEPSSHRVKGFIEFLADYSVDGVPLDPKVGDAATYLWNDPCTSTALERRNEFYLMDSAP